jgi:hypothetical protein
LHSGRGILGSDLRDGAPAPLPPGGRGRKTSDRRRKNIEFTPYFTPKTVQSMGFELYFFKLHHDQ